MEQSLNQSKVVFMNVIHSNTPAEELEKLNEMEILHEILPELTALKGVDRIGTNAHKDNFWHTIKVVRNTKNMTDNPWLICIAILHDIGKARTKRYDKNLGWTFHLHEEVGARMIDSIFKRLELPLEKLEYVKKLVALHGHVKELTIPNVSDSALRRFKLDIGNDLDDLLLFAKCDMTTKIEAKRQANIRSIDELKAKILALEEFDRVRTFEPPVSGQDIMDHFNIRPCKEVGIIKNQLKEEILNGTLPNDREVVFKRMIELGINLKLN
jgi:putative nucleotidyltransferase with HDIG domain